MEYVLIKPIITEKSIRNAQNGVFSFEVMKAANKRKVKGAIESTFKVHVEQIKTIVRKGKFKQVGRKRIKVKSNDIKIASVRLKKGEKIDYFEVGQTK